MVLLMMMPMSIVDGAQDTAPAANAAAGNAPTASASVEAAPGTAAVMAVVVVHQHARHAHRHGGTAATSAHASTAAAASAAATAGVIGRCGVGVVAPTRAPAQRAAAGAVVAQAAHMARMTHHQHATHNRSAASLAGIRSGVMALAHGTRRSRPTQGRVGRRHRGRGLHVVMRVRMRMRDIVVPGIDVPGGHHADAACAARGHAHSALQAAQRTMGAAMVAVTVMAAMVTAVGAATPAVQGDASGEGVVGRLDGADHRSAAHDVRQLVGLYIEVLGLNAGEDKESGQNKRSSSKDLSAKLCLKWL